MAVVCFAGLQGNVWSELKRLTPIFYYYFTKKAKMKINHLKTFIQYQLLLLKMSKKGTQKLTPIFNNFLTL